MYGNRDRAEVIGEKYRILRVLGEGGFGRVYLVRDEHIDRMYAMKKQSLANEADYQKEIQMLGALKHPGLPELHDVITDEGFCYIIMENVKGMTLERYVKENGNLGIKETMRIAAGLCEIISYLHRRPVPVIHGDLKPSNIMIDEGNVRLIDFGCALKAYSEAELKYGTPEYAAPEQQEGKICTGSDIYAFGKVMFYMLTGRTEVIKDSRRLNKTLKTYGIPAGVRKILLKCLQSDPKMRYQGGTELKEALGKIKHTGRQLPGLLAGYTATIIRSVGAGMVLYCLFYNKVSQSVGNLQVESSINVKEFFILGLLVFLAAVPWDAIARSRYKTAVLECECSILVTEGSCKYV